MNLLITGASGGLGRRLIPSLLARENIKIRTLAHRSQVKFPDCETVAGALEDFDSLVAATEGIDAVLHLAALTHSPNEADYFKINGEGTKNLIAACRRNKIRRFIFMSSGAAHPEGGAYSESKLAAEAIVKQSGLPWLILRPREVYGTEGKEGINQLMTWVRKFPVIPVIGDGRYSLNPVFIDDVVTATVESVFQTGVVGKTFALAGTEEIAYAALIDRLAGFFGVRVWKLFIPIPLLKWMVLLLNGLNIKTLVPDQIPRLLCDKSSRGDPEIPLLNFKPRNLEAGLQKLK
ncbi:MAG: NAD-dependent nucleoside diphosphate-sugar epimerase/dehydratase [Nitrospinaceae bacterium]|nr:MAG: NAD-dependent nucleoside diphosphate-sugar epimerase/dehydratase [Nitrospinaceae bacterium]